MKVMTQEEVAQFSATTRKNKQIVVLATGVFDILHQEHKKFLSKAAEAGDVLIVGVESDTRVKKIKGPGRPINPQNERAVAVASLDMVDAVFILPEKFSQPADHVAMIEAVRPDILAVSSHTRHLEAKRSIMRLFSGRVEVVHQFNPDVSTTRIIEQSAKETA